MKHILFIALILGIIACGKNDDQAPTFTDTEPETRALMNSWYYNFYPETGSDCAMKFKFMYFSYSFYVICDIDAYTSLDSYYLNNYDNVVEWSSGYYDNEGEYLIMERSSSSNDDLPTSGHYTSYYELKNDMLIITINGQTYEFTKTKPYIFSSYLDDIYGKFGRSSNGQIDFNFFTIN